MRYHRTGGKDISVDARNIRPFLNQGGGDTYQVKVSDDDTTPGYLSAKVTSADTSVVIAVVNDGADEDLDLSVAAYVAAEIATHASDADAHHDQVHVLATTSALGPDHTVSGLTAGMVLQATGAATAAFGLLNHNSLTNVTANQHHNQSHALASTSGLGADHTVSGLTAGQVLRATSATTAAFASLQATDLPSHVIATNVGLGSQHTISGATAGHVLRASGATAAAFAQLQHSDLGGVGANDHHNQSHVLATSSALGPDHTVSGLTSGHVLRATGATTAAFGALQASDLAVHVLATTSGLGSQHSVSGLTARQFLVATGATTALFRAIEDADIPASIARDSELHSQSHVLATTAGLGADHTVSGLTAGQVLRATGATTAAFASLQATDLPSHVLATNTALGSQHTISGATAGHVLRASGATTAAFAQLQHSDLGGMGANDHHNQSHVLASTSGLGADHTVSGLTARQVLVATGATTALFRAIESADLPTGAALSVSSSNSGTSHAITTSSAVSSATAVILATDSNGRLRVQGLGINAAATGDTLNVGGTGTVAKFGDGSGAAVLLVDGAAGQVRDMRYQSGGVNRWVFRVNNSAESGSDAGSNFQFIPYNDAGTAQPAAFTITRSSSAVAFSASASVAGDLTVGGNIAAAGDLTIATNGNQGDRFLMENSNVSGGSVFYDFNQTDRDAGSTGAFELGFYRDTNNITQVRMSKEVFEVIIKSGGTFRFPLEVRAQQVILAELPTSNPGIVGALYRSGGTVLIST
jgi:ribosomal protein L27